MLPQSAVREGVSEVNSRDSIPPLAPKNNKFLLLTLLNGYRKMGSKNLKLYADL
jgi:hypothetical protein